MTAATKDVYTKSARGSQIVVGVEASEVIYDGAVAGSNGSGYAQALAAGDIFIGICMDGQADNSDGSADAIDVTLRTKAVVKKTVAGIVSVEDIGKIVYATDDSTFTIVPPAIGSGSIVGRVDSFVSAGVAYVAFDTAVQFEQSYGIDGISAIGAQITTVSAVTLTAAQVLSGFIRHDPSGGAATDTLPTATLLLAEMPNAVVGTKFECVIRNDADASEVITVAAGSGGTANGTMTIAQNAHLRLLFEITNVTAGTLAYNVYSMAV